MDRKTRYSAQELAEQERLLGEYMLAFGGGGLYNETKGAW